MDKDTIIIVGDDKYVLDVEFKDVLNKLIIKTDEIGIENQIKLIRYCLGSKFNLKTNIYKEKKTIDNMLKIFFSDDVLFDVFGKPRQITQKKYYDKMKKKEDNKNIKYSIHKEITE